MRTIIVEHKPERVVTIGDMPDGQLFFSSYRGVCMKVSDGGENVYAVVLNKGRIVDSNIVDDTYGLLKPVRDLEVYYED